MDDVLKRTSGTGRSMELKKDNVYQVCAQLILYLRGGKSLEMFLADFDLSMTKWEKYTQKHPMVRQSIVDGQVFFIAFYQAQIAKWARDKDMSNSLSKLMFENNLGWIRTTELPTEAGAGSRNYRIIVEDKKESDYYQKRYNFSVNGEREK